MTEKTYGGKTLEELETLEQGATAVPWGLDERETRVSVYSGEKQDNDHHNANIVFFKNFGDPVCNDLKNTDFIDRARIKAKDCAFIAAARNALPDLIARVKELEADVKDARQLANTEAGIAQEHINACAYHFDRAEAAESRVEELEATLEEITEIHNAQAICVEQFAEVMAENAILRAKVEEMEFNFHRY